MGCKRCGKKVSRIASTCQYCGQKWPGLVQTAAREGSSCQQQVPGFACSDWTGFTCRALIEALLTDRVVERLRAAQDVLRFAERYGAERLEAACARALAHDNVQYRTVKTILARGLDREALVVVPHALLADEAEAELVDDAARSAVAGDVADGNLAQCEVIKGGDKALSSLPPIAPAASHGPSLPWRGQRVRQKAACGI
jgi:hypothetical protein